MTSNAGHVSDIAQLHQVAASTVNAALKILIVDDDVKDRFIVRQALHQSGVEYVLTEAADGVGAL